MVTIKHTFADFVRKRGDRANFNLVKLPLQKKNCYALFERSLAKKVLFFIKKQCFEQGIHYYMVFIAYDTDLICKFAITRQNNASVVKIANTRLTKIFVGNFAFDERLPTSATLSLCHNSNYPISVL